LWRLLWTFAITTPVSIPISSSISLRWSFVTAHLIDIFMLIKEVRDVEKGVSFQTYVHEGRLHAGKDARNTALMDTPGK